MFGLFVAERKSLMELHFVATAASTKGQNTEEGQKTYALL